MSQPSNPTPKKPTASAKPSEGQQEWTSFRSSSMSLFGTLMLALFIRTVLFEPFKIDGPSMEPTLLHGDRVVVAKMLYGLHFIGVSEALLTWNAPHVGDVVIVQSPADEKAIVKRVIGVAGDTIEFRAGALYRNGQLIRHDRVRDCEEESQKDEHAGCEVFEEEIEGVVFEVSSSGGEVYLDLGPIEIPEGHVFVRGDHRDRSNDSTNPLIGPVPITRIKGKALSLYGSHFERGGRGFLAGFRWERFFMPIR